MSWYRVELWNNTAENTGPVTYLTRDCRARDCRAAIDLALADIGRTTQETDYVAWSATPILTPRADILVKEPPTRFLVQFARVPYPGANWTEYHQCAVEADSLASAIEAGFAKVNAAPSLTGQKPRGWYLYSTDILP